jgi:hypothetical protein
MNLHMLIAEAGASARQAPRVPESAALIIGEAFEDTTVSTATQALATAEALAAKHVAELHEAQTLATNYIDDPPLFDDADKEVRRLSARQKLTALSVAAARDALANAINSSSLNQAACLQNRAERLEALAKGIENRITTETHPAAIKALADLITLDSQVMAIYSDVRAIRSQARDLLQINPALPNSEVLAARQKVEEAKAALSENERIQLQGGNNGQRPAAYAAAQAEPALVTAFMEATRARDDAQAKQENETGAPIARELETAAA